MSGIGHGAQEKCPLAINVNCTSQSLNLATSDACNVP